MDRVEEVIETLKAHGFVADGFTDIQHVRIPTTRAPVFGGIGGELATLGGRKRFARNGLKVTVGKRTAYFYRVANGKLDPNFGKRFGTKDIRGIKLFLESEAQKGEVSEQ